MELGTTTRDWPICHAPKWSRITLVVAVGGSGGGILALSWATLNREVKMEKPERVSPKRPPPAGGGGISSGKVC